jgi:hypothetical protein
MWNWLKDLGAYVASAWEQSKGLLSLARVFPWMVSLLGIGMSWLSVTFLVENIGWILPAIVVLQFFQSFSLWRRLKHEKKNEIDSIRTESSGKIELLNNDLRAAQDLIVARAEGAQLASEELGRTTKERDALVAERTSRIDFNYSLSYLQKNTLQAINQLPGKYLVASIKNSGVKQLHGIKAELSRDGAEIPCYWLGAQWVDSGSNTLKITNVTDSVNIRENEEGFLVLAKWSPGAGWIKLDETVEEGFDCLHVDPVPDGEFLLPTPSILKILISSVGVSRADQIEIEIDAKGQPKVTKSPAVAQ